MIIKMMLCQEQKHRPVWKVYRSWCWQIYCQAQPEPQVKLSLKDLFSLDPAHHPPHPPPPGKVSGQLNPILAKLESVFSSNGRLSLFLINGREPIFLVEIEEELLFSKLAEQP